MIFKNKYFFLNLSFLLLFLFGLSFIIAVESKDVAYLVVAPGYEMSNIQETISALNMSYDIIYNSQIPSTNFSKYSVLVVNNDFFTNWQSIPVNDKPAVLVNGKHIDDWGWTTISTKSSGYTSLLLNNNHSITLAFNSSVPIYLSEGYDVYSIYSNYMFSGITPLARKNSPELDMVIALVQEDSILTKVGKPDTRVNAKTVFFGITEANYWTNESKQLFKNSIMWVYGDSSFSLSILSEANLISIPLVLSDNSINNFKFLHPEISSIKTYSSGNIIEASIFENNKGYFVFSNLSSEIDIQGQKPVGNQTISLNKGMNLVGFNILSNKSLSSLHTEIKEVSRRNRDGSYSIATKYSFGWYNPGNIILEPGKGYWMKSNSQLNWSYSP
jgi:hypothetical protein